MEVGGGGFARFSRKPARPEDGTADGSTEAAVEDDPAAATFLPAVSAPWASDSVVNQALPSSVKDFDDFDDFGIPTESVGGGGGGFDFDDSLMSEWGEETENPSITNKQQEIAVKDAAGAKPAGSGGLSLFKRAPPSTATLVAPSTNVAPAFATPKPPSFNAIFSPSAVSREITPPFSGNGGGANNTAVSSKMFVENADASGVKTAGFVPSTIQAELGHFLLDQFTGSTATPPPPPTNAARFSFLTENQVLPSKTPANTTTRPTQVTAEKESVTPFKKVAFQLVETPAQYREASAKNNVAATALGKVGGGLTMEHDMESFKQVHEAFLSKTRDFGYQDENYTHALLDMNFLLSTSHAEVLRTQANVVDLTDRMETMSSEMDEFIRDCLAG